MGAGALLRECQPPLECCLDSAGQSGPVFLRIMASHHGEPRIAGVEDKGMWKSSICSRWFPDTKRVTDVVRCITLASVLPSRSSTTFGSGSFTNGSPACRARFASMNESSTPESTKSVSGRASCAHNNEPGKRMRDEDGQDDIVLASTPACTDKLSLLTTRGSRRCSGPAAHNTGRYPK